MEGHAEINHKAFLNSLDTVQRIELNKKSDVQGLVHFLFHLGAICLTGFLILIKLPLWPILMVLQGILIIFLFTLLHETCHQTPFKSVTVNRLVGHICGFLIFLPAIHFKYFHLAHHRHTNDPEHDPELSQKKPETFTQYVWHLSGLPVWYSHLRTILINALGKCSDEFVPQKRLASVRLEARVMLLVYLLVLCVSFYFTFTEILYVWLIPILLGQPFLRLYLMAEHGRCPHVANMFENTRTTFTSLLVRKLAWNMPYHAEHHACPTVPFYKLPELHLLVKSHLKQTENGYIQFHKNTIAELK